MIKMGKNKGYGELIRENIRIKRELNDLKELQQLKNPKASYHKPEASKKQPLHITVFGYVWLLGWFSAIWIWDYALQLFLTGLFSLFLASTFHKAEEKKKEDTKEKEDSEKRRTLEGKLRRLLDK